MVVYHAAQRSVRHFVEQLLGEPNASSVTNLGAGGFRHSKWSSPGISDWQAGGMGDAKLYL
jgi:hypothetical protein